MRSTIRHFTGSLAFMLAAAAAAPAQDQGSAPLEGLLIRECYTAANSLLRQADQAREKGEWAKAIEIYQEVLREYPDSLFALGPETFKDRKGLTFVNAAEYIEERLGGLPDEAREAYSALYEPRAKALLDSCDSPEETEPLVQAAYLYPVAPSGMKALGLLARIDLQNARWSPAGSRFRALLMRDRFHWENRTPEILSLAVALIQEGRSEALLQLASETRSRIGGDAGKSLGARLEALSRHTLAGEEAPEWMTRFGAGATGIGAVKTGLLEMPRAWQALAPFAPGVVGASSLTQFQSSDGYLIESDLKRRWRPYFPALYSDKLFIHNGIECRCHDLIFGGAPLWTFESSYGRMSKGGEKVVGNTNFEPNRIFTVTLDRDVVYMLMETPADSLYLDKSTYHGYEVIPHIPKRRLAALDARTGRLLYEVGAREKPLTLIDKISFTSEPLALDGKLYLGGAVFEGIPTSYVICLDASDGSVLWTRLIAAGSQELNMFGHAVREYCASPVSVRGDSLYFCTNLGAVASLKASTGQWRWVFRYPPVPRTKSVNFQTFKTPPSWIVSPVVAEADRIVVAPSDSDNLFALSPESGSLVWAVEGRPRWSLARRAQTQQDHLYLLGSSDGKAICHGSFTAAYHLRSGQIAWQHRFSTQSENTAGRGALAGGTAYIPSDEALYALDCKTGKTLMREPWQDKASEAGNVTVAGGYLVTATQIKINCFYDRGRLLDRIIGDARSRKGDPAAALRAGWICLRNGRLENALSFFESAREISTPGSDLAMDVNHGLYRAWMEQGAEDWKSGRRDKAIESFKKSLAFAPGEQEKITATLRILEHYRRTSADAMIVKTYRQIAADFSGAEYAFEGDPLSVRLWARFGLARHFDVAGDFKAAVAEYQAIIEGEGGNSFRSGMKSGPAEEMARTAIAEILSRRGREAYAEFDRRAADLLAEGREKRSAAALEELLEKFPNSLSCDGALLEIARIHLSAKDAARAEEALKRHLRDYPASPKTPEALALLASLLEAQGHTQRAKLVLLRLREKFPSAVVDDGKGGKSKASDWVEEKLADPAFKVVEAAEARPEIDWKNGSEKWAAKVRANPWIIPISGLRPLEFGPMILARAGEDVRAWSGMNGAELWSARTGGETVVEGYYCGDTLVLCGRYKAFGVNPANGSIQWTREFSQGSMIRGMAARNRIAAMMVNGIDGKSLHLWTVVIDADTGADLFDPRSLEQWGGISAPVLGFEVMLCYVREGTARVFGFDLVAGRKLFAYEVGDILNCPPILFESAGRAVFGTRTALVGLDLAGKERWSLTLGSVDRHSLAATGGLAVCARATDRALRELTAVDPADGRVAWRAETQLHSIHMMETAGGDLFVQGRRGVEWRLMRFGGADGKLKWAAVLGDQTSSIVTTLIGANAAVAKVARASRGTVSDGEFVFIDLESGRAVKTVPFARAPASSGFTLIDGSLVWSDEEGLKAFGGK